jgi:S-DNA-T family DNA segregation ATPase FtsK/SpoIIIE
MSCAGGVVGGDGDGYGYSTKWEVLKMRKKLEFQAGRIEAVLSLHGVPVRVTGGAQTPRWVRFQVLPAVGVEISRIKNLSEELAAALDTLSCRVSQRGVAVDVEVLRDDPQPVRLLPLYKQVTHPLARPSYPPIAAILGLAEDGAPLLIRLPSPGVEHILVAGDEGAGKTTLLQTIVLSLALANSPGLLAFVFLGDGLPGTAQVVRRMGFSAYRIERMGMAVIRAGIGTSGKRVVVVADDVVGDSSTAVARLAHLMRSQPKRHYVLGWLGVPPVEVANLFQARLVGRMSNAEDARTTTGRRGTGAERLLGQGDFLAIAEERVDRFQAACISEVEIIDASLRTGHLLGGRRGAGVVT